MEIRTGELKLTIEEVNDARMNILEGFEMLEEDMVGNWRHGTEHEGILKHHESEKLFKIHWRDSVKHGIILSGMMGSGPFTFPRVYPQKKEITIYKEQEES